MLRITLYKNCILNNKYQEVISPYTENGHNKNILEEYLDTLPKLLLEDIDEVYYKNNDKLNIDLELFGNTNIYEFNYMKILYYNENNELKLMRYCFINKINVNDEIVQLFYEEDIFSTYILDTKRTLPNKIIRKRFLPYNYGAGVYKISAEYLSSKKPILDYSENTLFYIIMTYQDYIGNSFGESTDRNYRTSLLEKATTHRDEESQQIVTDFKRQFNYSEVKEVLLNLVITQPKGRYTTTGTSHFYEIGDIYIIPVEYNVESFFNITPSTPYGQYIQVSDNNPTSDNAYYIVCWQPNNNKLYKEEIIYTSNDIDGTNFRILSIGTLNTQIPINNIGVDFNYSILFQIDEVNVKLYLSLQNSLYDISEDFLFDLPIKSYKGEEMSLARLSRNLGNISSFYKIASSFIPGKQGFNLSKAGSIGGSFIEGTSELIINNAHLHTSNVSSFVSSSGVINAHFGIIIFKIDSVNDDYINYYVENNGYSLDGYVIDNNFIINDFIVSKYFGLGQRKLHYDVVKFEKMNIIGSFTNEIANKLNEIFTNGVKIWYDYNLEQTDYYKAHS